MQLLLQCAGVAVSSVPCIALAMIECLSQAEQDARLNGDVSCRQHEQTCVCLALEEAAVGGHALLNALNLDQPLLHQP